MTGSVFLVFNLGVMVHDGLSERPGLNRIATFELSRLSLDMQAHDAYRWRRRDGTKNLQPGERAGQKQRHDERRLAHNTNGGQTVRPSAQNLNQV
jgi:hypothetical protein